MKKRLMAMVLAALMVSAALVGCGSKDAASTGSTTTAEATEDSEYQYVAPADAVKAAADGSAHVVDVREWDNYVAGRVVGSDWCPIFPLEDDSLIDPMKAYADANLKDGKDIYLICNSGQRGAQKATGVLIEAGVDPSKIFTVEGGAKALADVKGALTTDRTEEPIDWKYASASDVLAATGAQIVDVRDDETYAAGHLAGSKQVALKEFDTADAQSAAYALAETLDKNEPVYFLCYSGNKCAKTAISIFKDAGYDVNDLFIIENGAKDADIEAAFVTE